MNADNLIKTLDNTFIWDTSPVYCITTDIDWASEDVLSLFFDKLSKYNFNIDAFLTHKSSVIDTQYKFGNLIKNPHPNFCLPSSHGNTESEIIEYVTNLAPNSKGVRMHRLGTNSGIEHIFKEKYDYKFTSNCIHLLQQNIQPHVLESGMISFPIFFEDGTHLYQNLSLDFNKYKTRFESNGLKIINIHPIDFVLNSNSYEYMRNVRDTIDRKDYNSLSKSVINKIRNTEVGISDFVCDIFDFITKSNYTILTLNELYNLIENK